MTKPVLYDVFSGAGGAACGYQMAGFEVWGVDNRPQPRYCGERFIQADAFDFIRAVTDGQYPMPSAWHASPPCQAYSRMRRITKRDYPDLIEATRQALICTGLPYAIENVEGAPLRDYITLCGTMFGLPIRRHRWFELSPSVYPLMTPCSCQNGVATGRLIGQRLRGPKPGNQRVPPVFKESEKRSAIGVEWMTLNECQEAIPPAYASFIGKLLLEQLFGGDQRADSSPAHIHGTDAFPGPETGCPQSTGAFAGTASSECSGQLVSAATAVCFPEMSRGRDAQG